MKLGLIFTLFFLVFTLSCASSDDALECETNEDCGTNEVCNQSTNVCEKVLSDADAIIENPDDTSDNDSNTQPDNDPQTMECTPGETKKCEWVGTAEMENVGICKAGTSLCGADGRWTECSEQINPEPEACEVDGIDSDCDGNPDNLPAHTDQDGDGYIRCENDACDIPEECPGHDPALINPNAFEVPNNGLDDNSNGEIDEVVTCDSGVSMSGIKNNGEYLAKAMDTCEGYISATLSLAGDPVTESICDGPATQGSDGNSQLPPEIQRPSLTEPYFDDKYKTYAVANKFGNVITANKSDLLTILSTGPYNSPTMNASEATLDAGDMKTASKVPTDWINRQKNCKFPESEACKGEGVISTEELDDQCSGTESPSVQDPIMLTVKMKVPINANAFSFDFYFFSIEFPGLVCTEYNDFFIALLDSTFNEVNPNSERKNNWDKNMAVDDKKNPMGVSIAPNGIFRRCDKEGCSGSGIGGIGGGNKNGECDACEQPEELAGTGFQYECTTIPIIGKQCDGHGGTGWFAASGNVVPGEEITLRFAVWETGSVPYGPDHSYDTTVLLDNFQWYEKEVTPGIRPK